MVSYGLDGGDGAQQALLDGNICQAYQVDPNAFFYTHLNADAHGVYANALGGKHAYKHISK